MATTIPTGVKPHVSESPIDLYYSQLSSQCRAVMMVGALLGVKFNVNNVDRGERNLRKMLKRHEVVPFIKDNGLVLTQSIAIMCYLAEKFKKTDTLYPVDLKKRAVVHEMLSFDQRTLYQRFARLYYPLFLNNTSLDPEKKRAMDKGYSTFNNFLAEYKPWADGEHMTIADISLAATVSTAQCKLGSTNGARNSRDLVQHLDSSLHLRRHVLQTAQKHEPITDVRMPEQRQTRRF